GNPHQALKDKGVINSGFLRHMARNISFLSDFEEINGGYVAFRRNPKGGKITGKDPLGKFDRKADEGFLVGYSFNSKAFRVFNSRTRIVQETLHINFIENKPNVVGIGPKWLFDIDTLTQSMNYQPVVVGNQPNDNADLQNSDDAAFDVKENEKDVHVSPSSCEKPKKHDDKDKRDDKGKSLIDLSTGVKDLIAEFEEFSINSTNRVNAASAHVTTAEPNLTNSTNSFNTASPSDIAISPNFRIAGNSSFVDPSNYPDDLDMSALEDIVYSDDKEDVGVEADFSNLETNISGHTPDEGINYDEVFALVERIKAVRLFLAYASFMGFMAYQMDVKSAFVYGTIEEELYVCQPPGFKDPDYLDKVYKVVKALYRLHQAPRAWKFGFTDVKSASTPIETEKPLLKDPDGEDVDVHIYMSMTGSLMYLTSSRPDIMYLKGKPYLGLWYPKHSPLNLVAYSDSDYAGASLDRKSTTGGCQFLGSIDSKSVDGLWKVNDVVQLRALIDRKKVVVTEDVIRQALRLDDANGVKCLPNEEIFTELARMGYEKPPPNTKRTAWNKFSCSMASAVICLATVLINNQVDELSSHTTRYTSLALSQKVFANMRRVGKGFSRVETLLFASMLVPPQPQAVEEEDDVEVPAAPTLPSPTNAPSPPPQDPIPIPPITT
nr:ribonuclease H-like domain, reverse transcriptase, RNA-dependent DNA polymerase [Tanacetum cinerariifolium]